MVYKVEIDTSLSIQELQKQLDDWVEGMNDPNYRGFGWKPPIHSLEVSDEPVEEESTEIVSGRRLRA